MRAFKLALIIVTALSASIQADPVPPYFTTTPFPNQRLFIENINLSAKDFSIAYMSKSEAERRYAELYFLGVLDATEGTLWCSYKKFKTDTIGETIYLTLKDLKPAQQTERASKIITRTLSTRYPCKEALK